MIRASTPPKRDTRRGVNAFETEVTPEERRKIVAAAPAWFLICDPDGKARPFTRERSNALSRVAASFGFSVARRQTPQTRHADTKSALRWNLWVAYEPGKHKATRKDGKQK